MLIVISPAKTLDFDTPPVTKTASKPTMLSASAELVEQMRAYSASDLVDLMGISAKLGELNHQRFQQWQPPFNAGNAKQALLAFRGDVYSGIDADAFSEQDFDFAQQHLRILSGLYGLLRPLDYIQPYRLEMGVRVKNSEGDTLYDFWGDSLAKAINKQLKALSSDTLINLASNEYFKAIDRKALNVNVITPVFKDYKNGKYKIISFFAKKARGMMSAYIINNKLTEPESIKGFDTAGYYFDADSSTSNSWTFLRDEPQ